MSNLTGRRRKSGVFGRLRAAEGGRSHDWDWGARSSSGRRSGAFRLIAAPFHLVLQLEVAGRAVGARANGHVPNDEPGGRPTRPEGRPSGVSQAPLWPPLSAQRRPNGGSFARQQWAHASQSLGLLVCVAARKSRLMIGHFATFARPLLAAQSERGICSGDLLCLKLHSGASWAACGRLVGDS